MSYRYGAYPRAQRMAILFLIMVTTGLFWLIDVVFLVGNEATTEDIAAAAILRSRQEAEEQKNYRPPPEAFAFDPNTVTASELERLGLSKKQATGWLKFRGNRTNAFRQPEDIGKLYVLREDDKARLIPLAYVVFSKTANKAARTQVQSFAFNPNTVGAEDLVRLGLSPKQAAAFVNYRSFAKYGRAFRKPEDIRRIKTMSNAQKDHLVSLAVIPPKAEKPIAAAQRFRFDPNTISVDSFQLLGFPEWQAKSLLRYRGDRPVTFRRATDLRRVKSLDSTLVEAVLELIDLAPTTDNAYFDKLSTSPAATPGTASDAAPSTYSYKSKPPPPAPNSFDINTADTTAWRSLPGIGSYRAKRIVRFRDALGGFASVEQVGTTRGLPDSTFQKVRNHLTTSKIYRPLAINRATYNEFKKHPYINRNLANSIVKNREKFGRFNGPEDLRRLRLITEDNLPQLLPYFSFE